MKNLIFICLLSISILSCKKESLITEPIPTDITITTKCFPNKSHRVLGGYVYWINIKTSYSIKSKLFLHVSFNNEYFSGNNNVKVIVQMPYLSKDTLIETYQYQGSLGEPSKYKIDSITGQTNFNLIY